MEGKNILSISDVISDSIELVVMLESYFLGGLLVGNYMMPVSSR